MSDQNITSYSGVLLFAADGSVMIERGNDVLFGSMPHALLIKHKDDGTADVYTIPSDGPHKDKMFLVTPSNINQQVAKGWSVTTLSNGQLSLKPIYTTFSDITRPEEQQPEQFSCHLSKQDEINIAQSKACSFVSAEHVEIASSDNSEHDHIDIATPTKCSYDNSEHDHIDIATPTKCPSYNSEHDHIDIAIPTKCSSDISENYHIVKASPNKCSSENLEPNQFEIASTNKYSSENSGHIEIASPRKCSSDNSEHDHIGIALPTKRSLDNSEHDHIDIASPAKCSLDNSEHDRIDITLPTKCSSDNSEHDNIDIASPTKCSLDNSEHDDIDIASPTKCSLDNSEHDDIDIASPTKCSLDNSEHDDIGIASPTKRSLDNSEHDGIDIASPTKCSLDNSEHDDIDIASPTKCSSNKSEHDRIDIASSEKCSSNNPEHDHIDIASPIRCSSDNSEHDHIDIASPIRCSSDNSEHDHIDIASPIRCSSDNSEHDHIDIATPTKCPSYNSEHDHIDIAIPTKCSSDISENYHIVKASPNKCSSENLEPNQFEIASTNKYSSENSGHIEIASPRKCSSDNSEHDHIGIALPTKRSLDNSEHDHIDIASPAKCSLDNSEHDRIDITLPTKCSSDNSEHDNIDIASPTKCSLDNSEHDDIDIASPTKCSLDNSEHDDIDIASPTKCSLDNSEHDDIGIASPTKRSLDNSEHDGIDIASPTKCSLDNSEHDDIDIASPTKCSSNKSEHDRIDIASSEKCSSNNPEHDHIDIASPIRCSSDNSEHDHIDIASPIRCSSDNSEHDHIDIASPIRCSSDNSEHDHIDIASPIRCSSDKSEHDHIDIASPTKCSLDKSEHDHIDIALPTKCSSNNSEHDHIDIALPTKCSSNNSEHDHIDIASPITCSSNNSEHDHIDIASPITCSSDNSEHDHIDIESPTRCSLDNSEHDHIDIESPTKCSSGNLERDRIKIASQRKDSSDSSEHDIFEIILPRKYSLDNSEHDHIDIASSIKSSSDISKNSRIVKTSSRKCPSANLEQDHIEIGSPHKRPANNSEYDFVKIISPRRYSWDNSVNDYINIASPTKISFNILENDYIENTSQRKFLMGNLEDPHIETTHPKMIKSRERIKETTADTDNDTIVKGSSFKSCEKEEDVNTVSIGQKEVLKSSHIFHPLNNRSSSVALFDSAGIDNSKTEIHSKHITCFDEKEKETNLSQCMLLQSSQPEKSFVLNTSEDVLPKQTKSSDQSRSSSSVICKSNVGTPNQTAVFSVKFSNNPPTNATIGRASTKRHSSGESDTQAKASTDPHTCNYLPFKVAKISRQWFSSRDVKANRCNQTGGVVGYRQTFSGQTLDLNCTSGKANLPMISVLRPKLQSNIEENSVVKKNSKSVSDGGAGLIFNSTLSEYKLQSDGFSPYLCTRNDQNTSKTKYNRVNVMTPNSNDIDPKFEINADISPNDKSVFVNSEATEESERCDVGTTSTSTLFRNLSSDLTLTSINDHNSGPKPPAITIKSYLSNTALGNVAVVNDGMEKRAVRCSSTNKALPIVLASSRISATRSSVSIQKTIDGQFSSSVLSGSAIVRVQPEKRTSKGMSPAVISIPFKTFTGNAFSHVSNTNLVSQNNIDVSPMVVTNAIPVLKKKPKLEDEVPLFTNVSDTRTLSTKICSSTTSEIMSTEKNLALIPNSHQRSKKRTNENEDVSDSVKPKTSKKRKRNSNSKAKRYVRPKSSRNKQLLKNEEPTEGAIQSTNNDIKEMNGTKQRDARKKQNSKSRSSVQRKKCCKGSKGTKKSVATIDKSNKPPQSPIMSAKCSTRSVDTSNFRTVSVVTRQIMHMITINGQCVLLPVNSGCVVPQIVLDKPSGNAGNLNLPTGSGNVTGQDNRNNINLLGSSAISEMQNTSFNRTVSKRSEGLHCSYDQKILLPITVNVSGRNETKQRDCVEKLDSRSKEQNQNMATSKRSYSTSKTRGSKSRKRPIIGSVPKTCGSAEDIQMPLLINEWGKTIEDAILNPSGKELERHTEINCESEEDLLMMTEEGYFVSPPNLSKMENINQSDEPKEEKIKRLKEIVHQQENDVKEVRKIRFS